MNGVNVNPVFADLNNAETLKKGVKKIIKKDVAIPHIEILEKLIEQFQLLDFQALAFPSVQKMRTELKNLAAESEEAKGIRKQIDKLKPNIKHYLILSIENVLNVAKKNRWGICKNQDFIYLFNGAYWSNIDKETLQKFLGEATEKMGVTKFSARYYDFREKLFKQFLATAYLPTPPMDKDTVLINLENGTFEIGKKGVRLRPFDANDFLTYQLPFKYNPKAKAPIFQKYLNEVLPDISRQKVISEFSGFVFIKHGSKQLKEEKALILHGDGANGKSVFYEVLTALLGKENTSYFTLQELTDQHGYNRASIANKLVNYSSEISGKMETNIFKNMVSGEVITGRFPYGRPMKIEQYAKLIFNCNKLPSDVEQTNGFFRRFLIIPFDVTIPEDQQDKTLHTKIIEKELSGVFNWVLDGLKRLLEQKRFTECIAAKEAVERYKIESDSVKMFLSENDYKSHPTSYQLVGSLYTDYRCFCNDDGFKPVNKMNFRKRLEGAKLLVEKNRVGNIVYLIKAAN
jgi:putative DNA primase/helicase